MDPIDGMDSLEKTSFSQTGKGKRVSLASKPRTEKGPPLCAYRYFVEVVVFRSEYFDVTVSHGTQLWFSRIQEQQGPVHFFTHLLTYSMEQSSS